MGYPSSNRFMTERCAHPKIAMNSKCTTVSTPSSDQEGDDEEPVCKTCHDLACYSYKDFPEKSLSIMETYWVQEKLCDIEIQLDDDNQPVRSHRVVLAAASPYFRAMFTSNFEDASKGRVHIKGISKTIMLQVLKFAYSGQVKMITDDNVCDLLAAGNMLQIREIVDACSRYLESQLDPCNCIGIQRFAEQHGLKKLTAIAEKYINEHFSEVCQGEEFLDLKFCQMCQILKKCVYQIKDDCLLLEACLRWVKKDMTNREPWLRTILQLLRASFSTVDYLETLILTCPLIKDKKECVEYLQKIVQSRSARFPCVLYVVGGYYVSSLSQCEIFNASDGSWTSAPPLPVARSGLASVFVDRRLYVLGGRIHQRNNEQIPVLDTNFVHAFDIETHSWTEGPPLMFPRNRLGAVSLDGCIYVTGGSCQTTFINSVERFDIANNTWKFCAPMNIARCGHGCTTSNGKIYVIGGCTGTEKLDSVEVYDPAEDKWTLLKSMPEPRSGLGTACVGEYIYAIGGCEPNGQTNKVERYNTETNEWETVASLSEARSGLSVVTMANKVYAIGGFNGTQFLTSMEVYNQEKDEWCSAPSLLLPRSGHAAAAPV